jgi:hypothetical protein
MPSSIARFPRAETSPASTTASRLPSIPGCAFNGQAPFLAPLFLENPVHEENFRCEHGLRQIAAA